MNKPSDPTSVRSPKQLSAEDLASFEADTERQNAALSVRTGVRAGVGNVKYKYV